MTPEERADECMKRHPDAGANDSMFLPIDLKERIARAIRAAVAEERVAIADRADVESLAAYQGWGCAEHSSPQAGAALSEFADDVRDRGKEPLGLGEASQGRTTDAAG